MARKFNGTSDRVIVDAALTQPSWWNDTFGRAYAGWIKAPAGQSNVGIYSEGSSSSNTPFWFLSITQSGTGTANGLRWVGASTPTAATSAVIADNTWHHIALVIDQTGNPPTTGNQYLIYVDGVLDTSARMTSTQGGPSSTNEATFGCLRRTTAANFLNGLLAHWAIWNRPLSGEEVRLLARGYRLPSELEPQNYWPLTGPDANIAQSLGKRHNHGTLVGTTFSADVPPLVGRPQPALWHQRYARWRVPQLALPFINSVTATYTPSLVGNLAVPFIASVTAVYAPTVSSEVDVPFISSVTAVYTPALQGDVAVPFISSTTTLYTPTVTSASPEVDVPFIASTSQVYAPGLPTQVTSGQTVIAADDANVYPIAITESQVLLTSDGIQISGPFAATSGVLDFDADNPVTAGPITPTSSGVLLTRADSPLVVGTTTPRSGKFTVGADAPTFYPVAAQTAALTLGATGPTIQPAPAASGRLILAATGPTIYPISATTAILLLKADAPSIFSVSIILDASGILRLRSDVPVITPLTEPPPPPPPPPPGTGARISGTV
jgi:hypothetical protein